MIDAMPKLIPLPRELRARPFTVEEARALGLSPKRMRGRDLSAPFRGVRTRAGAPLPTLERWRACSCAISSRHFFTHLTAARLWNVPLARALYADAGIQVSVSPPVRAPRLAGVQGHQCSIEHLRVCLRYGLPVADAASTWIGLASILPLDELVIAGDHFVVEPRVQVSTDVRPYVTLAELSARILGYSGRGATAARAALGLVREHAESRQETRLRLSLVRAGLPEPELSAEICDAAGVRIGYADMAYRARRVLVEYDGAQHRESEAQYEHDLDRDERLDRAGYTVVHIRKRHMVWAASEAVQRVRRALSESRARASS